MLDLSNVQLPPNLAAAPRRARFRHAGAVDRDAPARQRRAHGNLACSRLRAARLSDRQRIRRRDHAEEGRSRGSRARMPSPSTSASASPSTSRTSRSRSVLQLIADVSDLNIVVADSVQGNVTLRLDQCAVGPGARHRPAGQGSRQASPRQRDLGRADSRRSPLASRRSPTRASRSRTRSRWFPITSRSATARPRTSPRC